MTVLCAHSGVASAADGTVAPRATRWKPRQPNVNNVSVSRIVEVLLASKAASTSARIQFCVSLLVIKRCIRSVTILSLQFLHSILADCRLPTPARQLPAAAKNLGHTHQDPSRYTVCRTTPLKSLHLLSSLRCSTCFARVPFLCL